MSSLAELESELAQRQDDLNTCNEMLALDPTSTDALETIPMLEADIADLKAKIAAKKKKKDAVSPPPPPSADAVSPPKFDMSKHPKFQNAAASTPPPPPAEETHAAPVVFNVKDNVMAKWSEDKQWYAATIVSKTGSSTDPVYKVTFKGYGNTETKRKREVRAVIDPNHNSKKRKADGTPAAAATAIAPPPPPPPPPQQQTSPTIPAPPPSNPAIISAAPTADPTIPLPKKREPSKVSDGPTRLPPEPKKLKGNKALDKQKSSWQDFQKSGPKKAVGSGMGKVGKESQFRTADLPGAKVGFTGSGKPMSKDQARRTWKYGGGGEMEED